MMDAPVVVLKLNIVRGCKLPSGYQTGSKVHLDMSPSYCVPSALSLPLRTNDLCKVILPQSPAFPIS